MVQTSPVTASTSIGWAIDELKTELNQALRCLERYAEQGQKQDMLDNCVAHLKQVAGIFSVTGVTLPNHLCRELQDTLIGGVSSNSEALSSVAEAILELIAYLGNPDKPNRLIPQINNLRALAERNLFTESPAFELSLDAGLVVFKRSSGQPLDSRTIRKLRILYQRSVLTLIKDGISNETMAGLRKVFKVLYQMGVTSYLSAVGYSGLALVERLQDTELVLSPALKSVFRRLDDMLRKLISGANYEDLGILKNALFYVALGSNHGDLSSKLVRIFALDSFASSSADAMGGSRSGIETELVAKVVDALQSEIGQAKTWLDDCLHQACEFNEAIKAVSSIFKRVDDTLIMVNADGPRETTSELLELLTKWQPLTSETDIDPLELNQFATAVVQLENSLLLLSKPQSANDDDIDHAEFGTAKSTILTESRIALTQIKTSITQFIETNWQWTQLQDVPASLAMVEGALRFYPLEGLAKVANCIRRYVRESLLENKHEPDQTEIDLFADVIVAIDYYLECLERGTAFNLDYLIERSLDNCQRLGYVYEEPSTESEGAENAGKTDDVEIDGDQLFQDTTQFTSESAEVEAESLENSADASAIPASPEHSETDQEQEDSPGTQTDTDEIDTAGKTLNSASEIEADTRSIAESEDDEIDEIVEIFVEEANEILPQARNHMVEWREHNDKAALLELRRAFHTLKGGGRMVGAVATGELSWAVENLLNRVIEESVTDNEEIRSLTSEAIELCEGLMVELSAKGSRQQQYRSGRSTTESRTSTGRPQQS